MERASQASSLLRKSFSFTLVQYNGGDGLGFLLAGCSLLPLAIFILQLSALFFIVNPVERRRALWLVLGQISNEVLSNVLKLIFAIDRPQGNERQDYAMPSSHAQFMGFLMVAQLAGLFAVPQQRSDPWPIVDELVQRLLPVATVGCTAVVIFSR